MSHPARGAWIEISMQAALERYMVGRTPQGVRGLKSARDELLVLRIRSHPARGAWIEILSIAKAASQPIESHPARGAWIEMLHGGRRILHRKSHPATGGWIEMSIYYSD